MYTATLEIEYVDKDVCVGNYDGYVTVPAYVVSFYKDDEKLDEHCYMSDVVAQAAIENFEAGRFEFGEYGDVQTFS